MIVLHGAALDGHLYLWGETPADESPAEPKRRGRKPAKAPPPRSPFDASFDRVIGGIDPDFGLKSQRLVAWLPAVGGAPVASSSLVAPPPGGNDAPTLAPFTVTAVRLSPPIALELLAQCADAAMIAPGVIVGRDLGYWAAAMRFAGALVVRQQYLPGLALADGAWYSRWQPAASGADAARLATLAARMPHACRALSIKSDRPPDEPAAIVLASVLESFVDQIVRLPATPAPARHAGLRPRSFDSVHHEWLHTLRSAEGRMHGAPEELARLSAQIEEWRRPVAATAAAPFRLCLRLEEPAGEPEGALPAASADSKWRVRYLLQDAADPSLLIPAESAFRTKGAASTALERRGLSTHFNARAYLLSALGQCAALCPRIEGSLRSPAPSGYDTDAVGAHDFLTNTAFLLEQAGFGVLLPAWWTRKGTKQRLAVRATVKSPTLQTSAGLTLDRILRVDWEVALGDEKLGLAELKALAKLKAPLVRVRGQWVELNPEEIRAALDFWTSKGEQTTARDVVRMALGGARPPGGLEFAGVAATGWVGDLLSRLHGADRIEELSAPAGLLGTLRPYQSRGFAWLEFMRSWGFGACLADDMGLGKSIQTLATIAREWEAGERRPSLIVCPTSVVANWQNEVARFTPELPVMVHHGLERARGTAFRKAAASHAIVVSTYALLQRDLAFLEGVPWRGVVLDEAQNIKNPETKQARAARALKADYRVALTGTPVENNVGDLWSIMEFLNPGWLGTQAEFRRSFFLPIQTTHDPDATSQLKKLTGPFVLRRLKSDRTVIADLPEKLEMKVYCSLTKEQATLYQAVADEATDAIARVDGMARRGLVLATLMKLKQVCNHPAQFLGDNSTIPGRSGKLARLTEMLEESLAEGDRALVFTQFAVMGEILKRHLQETFGRETLFLHGAVPKTQRDRMVESFQGEGGPPVFVLSLKAGGTGLNLTAANRVFHFDRWWNPAVEDQATDRTYRIGQSRNVQVHKFVCAGTLEEKIDELIESKKEVADRVVGTGEGWLTELSTAELKNLFALRREAVGE